jgi:hypothetical protein
LFWHPGGILPSSPRNLTEIGRDLWVIERIIECLQSIDSNVSASICLKEEIPLGR